MLDWKINATWSARKAGNESLPQENRQQVYFHNQLGLMERQTVSQMTIDNKISILRRVEMEVAHHHTDL